MSRRRASIICIPDYKRRLSLPSSVAHSHHRRPSRIFIDQPNGQLPFRRVSVASILVILIFKNEL